MKLQLLARHILSRYPKLVVLQPARGGGMRKSNPAKWIPAVAIACAVVFAAVAIAKMSSSGMLEKNPNRRAIRASGNSVEEWLAEYPASGCRYFNPKDYGAKDTKYLSTVYWEAVDSTGTIVKATKDGKLHVYLVQDGKVQHEFEPHEILFPGDKLEDAYNRRPGKWDN